MKIHILSILAMTKIKMSKTLSVKYYQENKERLQKKLTKDIKIFLKKKKKKSGDMVENVTKISQKMKDKNFESIDKNIYKNCRFTSKSWFRWKQWKIINWRNY